MVNSASTCVILAGGAGSRLRGLIGDCPKPLAMVNGRPFLDWILFFLAANGIDQAVISTGYRGDIFEDYVKHRLFRPIRVSCIREADALGTGGGLAHVAVNMQPASKMWLICNGDTLALAPLSILFSALLNPRVDGVVLGVTVSDISRFGSMIMNRDGNLIGFAENRQGAGIVNAGVYLLRDEIIRDLPQGQPCSLESEAIPSWIEAGRTFRVATAKCPFIDIGTPNSFYRASDFVRSHRSTILAGGIVGHQ